MYYVGKNYTQPSSLEQYDMYGLGIRHQRHGVHQIIPNVFSARFMYSLIFNHTPVDITVDGCHRALPANTLCVWDVDCRVYYGTPKSTWSISWLQFFPPMIEKNIKQYEIQLNHPITLDDERIIDRYFLAIYEEFGEYLQPDLDLVAHAAAGVLLEFRRASRHCDAKQLVIPPAFSELRKYIEENFRSRLTLNTLAARVHLEPSYLSRQFKKYFGQSPIDYLVARRLDEAAYSLKSTTLSVQQIASQSGYDNFYHFSKLFKRHYGISPSDFRKRLKC